MTTMHSLPAAGRPGRPGLVALLFAASLMLGLSACGTAPPQAADERPAEPAPSRGGAYYKDDGPDASPPADLDRIPDAEPRPEPLHRFANRPYNVFGQDYVPATALAPLRERGRASWYGRRFHGKPTASGERYDMYAMTAAHPTLPIPSYVRVTKVGNGRSVVVRINDRGPFHKGRIIDLSYTAAHRLGYVNAGSAMVELETILPGEVEMVAAARPVPPVRGRAPQPAGAPAPSGETPAAADPIAEIVAATPSAMAPARPAVEPAPGVFLQLGVFSSMANAEGFLAMVRDELDVIASRLQLLDDGGRFRLHLGPFASADDARAEAERIARVLKFRPFVIAR
jgi:rare lipoprotein A